MVSSGIMGNAYVQTWWGWGWWEAHSGADKGKRDDGFGVSVVMVAVPDGGGGPSGVVAIVKVWGL